jgi:hypothetical protein
MIHEDIIKHLEKEGINSIYLKLLAYAQMKINKLTWRHGHKGATRGQLSRDFCQKAIADTLTGKRTWNKEKYPTILEFLKSVISSLISNEITGKEHKTSTHIDIYDRKEEFKLPIVSGFPSAEDKLVANDLEQKLRQAICNAEDETGMLELVYLSIMEKQLTPQEISKSLDIDIKVVYNAKKRIKRIFTKLLKSINDE